MRRASRAGMLPARYAQERVRAIDHLSLAAATVISAQMLITLPNGVLGGMPAVAWTAIVMALAMPVMLWVVQGRVVRAEKLRSAAVIAHANVTNEAA